MEVAPKDDVANTEVGKNESKVMADPQVNSSPKSTTAKQSNLAKNVDVEDETVGSALPQADMKMAGWAAQLREAQAEQKWNPEARDAEDGKWKDEMRSSENHVMETDDA
ncbi:hypothetical protein D910_01417 [Dendroctonus ponderosae]